MTGCAWEGTGLRLAITVDSNIFFANIHPKYTWCFFKRTLIFSTGLWTANGIAITFWDTHSNIVSPKAKLYIYIFGILTISAFK